MVKFPTLGGIAPLIRQDRRSSTRSEGSCWPNQSGIGPGSRKFEALKDCKRVKLAKAATANCGFCLPILVLLKPDMLIPTTLPFWHLTPVQLVQGSAFIGHSLVLNPSEDRSWSSAALSAGELNGTICSNVSWKWNSNNHNNKGTNDIMFPWSTMSLLSFSADQKIQTFPSCSKTCICTFCIYVCNHNWKMEIPNRPIQNKNIFFFITLSLSLSLSLSLCEKSYTFTFQQEKNKKKLKEQKTLTWITNKALNLQTLWRQKYVIFSLSLFSLRLYLFYNSLSLSLSKPFSFFSWRNPQAKGWFLNSEKKIERYQMGGNKNDNLAMVWTKQAWKQWSVKGLPQQQLGSATAQIHTKKKKQKKI